MKAPFASAVLSLGLTLAVWPLSGLTQSDRDFLFTDEDGHLVIRFAGTGSRGLDSTQVDEISNAEFSRMVHDRLRADLLFEAEPRDPLWAASMEPQVAEHVGQIDLEFSDIIIECRAASCRVVMEQPVHWSIPEHQIVLETVQASLEAFIADRRHHLEPVFMITAYYQDDETSHIKAFLRRVGDVPASKPVDG